MGDPLPRVSKKDREELVEKVLASEDARATARRLAADRDIPYAALWQWSVSEARRRALEIGAETLRSALSSRGKWLALLARCKADSTGCGYARLEELQECADLGDAELRRFWDLFPADQGDAETAEWILSRRDCPDDILREAVEQSRGLTVLAHREGPKWLLEEVMPLYPFEEPALTLLADYYATDEYSVGDVLRFVRSLPHAHREACQRAVSRRTRFPEDKRVALRMEVELSSAVRLRHLQGRPNGWLLGWDRDRHFAGFTACCSGYPCANLTSFDYDFCNTFEVGVGDRGQALRVRLSFVAPVAERYWTKKPIRKEQEALAALEEAVDRWIGETGFRLLPPEIGELPMDVELELADKDSTTLWKCLFADYA